MIYNLSLIKLYFKQYNNVYRMELSWTQKNLMGNSRKQQTTTSFVSIFQISNLLRSNVLSRKPVLGSWKITIELENNNLSSTVALSIFYTCLCVLLFVDSTPYSVIWCLCISILFFFQQKHSELYFMFVSS